MTENFTGNQWNSSSLPDSHLIDCHLAKINISQIRQSVLCGNTRECCVVVILSLVNKHGDDKLNIVPASADRQPPFIIHIEAGVSRGQWREHDPDNGGWLASHPRSQNSDGCRPSVHRPQHSQLNYQKISTDPIIAAQSEFDIQLKKPALLNWLLIVNQTDI